MVLDRWDEHHAGHVAGRCCLYFAIRPTSHSTRHVRRSIGEGCWWAGAAAPASSVRALGRWAPAPYWSVATSAGPSFGSSSSGRRPLLGRAALLLSIALTVAGCSNSSALDALDDLEGRISSLESQASDYEDRIDALETLVEKLQGEIDDLETSVSRAQATANEAKSIGERARRVAEEALSCAEAVQSALESLTLDEVEFGVSVSC